MPMVLIKMSEVGNMVVFSEKMVVSNPRFFGIILVVLAAVIYYLYMSRH